MENEPRSASRFVSDRLPWLVAGAALVLYLITLNRWMRIESVTTVAKMTGWDVAPLVYAPLLYLVCLPARLLPAGLQPLALNVLTAVMAALTLALLARSVALLPLDRTRETRVRGSGGAAVLADFSVGWVPVALTVVLCGLQLTFWEHATAATGEMLDLFLFAWLIHALLGYRIAPGDGRLLRFAFVYGLAVTQNFAMIAFFPCFLVAVIRLKSWEFLRLKFIGTMLAAGLAGLLLYLLLPVVGIAGGDGTLSFWDYLRAQLGSQREALKAMPPYVVLLLSFTSLLPVLLISIRWSPASGETSVAGESLTVFLLWAVQALLLVACVAVFFDPRFSPRALGQGFGAALLPFYYLAALSVGYFVGYFLVMTEPARTKGMGDDQGLMRRLRPVLVLLGVVLMTASAGVLLRLNYPRLRIMDGRLLGGLADRLIASLPQGPSYVLGDLPIDLMLVESRLRSRAQAPPLMLVHSRSLEYTKYHQSLARRYPGRWPELKDIKRLPEPIDNTLILGLVSDLARSNRVCYLNPSFGYFFEGLQLVPRGMSYDLRPLAPAVVKPPPLTLADLDTARRFWDAEAAGLESIPAPPGRGQGVIDQWYAAQFYSRALNHWGVTLQRAGDIRSAAKAFHLALKINPENVVASTNVAFNDQLRSTNAPIPDLGKSPDLPFGYRSLDSMVLANGPLDDPRWTMAAGQMFAQGTLFRQALVEFDRTLTLVPGSTAPLLWRQNMEIMGRFRMGDLTGAEQEALSLQVKFPRDENAVEALTQIYLLSGRPTNALASVERQLQINPENQRALLNKAGLCIQLGRFAEAIPPLDKLLARQPEHEAALLNRAIAHLQSGHLDPAREDYQALAKLMPDAPPVQYGLGEVAYRAKDAAKAITHYEAYLKHATKGTAEYKQVQERLEALRRGEKPR